MSGFRCIAAGVTDDTGWHPVKERRGEARGPGTATRFGGTARTGASCRPFTLRLASRGGGPMAAHVEIDIAQVWRDYVEARERDKESETARELRNQLVEKYLSLVKYNADRIWARLPD